MIKSVVSLPVTPEIDGISVRIKALHSAYGQLLELYCQYEDDRITAVIAKLGVGCTLYAETYADFSELDSFFNYLGAEVFCDAETGSMLNAAANKSASLLEFRSSVDSAEIGETVKMGDLYKLLQNGVDGDIKLPCFADWYGDFCLRFNHGCADYFCLKNAVAVCGFKTKDEAFITGVAVGNADRGKGLGKRVVTGLVAKLRADNPQRRVFVAATDSKVPFYEKVGFKPIGDVSVLQY